MATSAQVEVLGKVTPYLPTFSFVAWNPLLGV